MTIWYLEATSCSLPRFSEPLEYSSSGWAESFSALERLAARERRPLAARLLDAGELIDCGLELLPSGPLRAGAWFSRRAWMSSAVVGTSQGRSKAIRGFA